MKRYCLLITIFAGLVAAVAALVSCIITVEIEGDYAAPDSIQMSMVIEMAGEKLPGIEAVKTGEDVYVKDPETGQWMRGEDVEEYEQYSSLEDFALDAIEYILAFEATGMLDDGDINGIPCYHAAGMIKPEKIPAATREALPEDTEPFDVELWIGKSDYLVHQLMLEFDLEDSADVSDMMIPAGTFTITYRFSDFDEPVNIAAPELN